MESLEYLAVVGFGLLIIMTLIIIVSYVLNSIGLYKIFKKAGNKAWAAFIPYYCDWTLIEVSGCHWWYFLIIIANSFLGLFVSDEGFFALISGLLGLVSLYIILCIHYNIAKKFNQGIGFAIGMTLVPIVFYLILGFSKSYQFNADVVVSPWGLYDFDKKTTGNNGKSFCSNCGSEISGNFCPKCGTSKKGE